MGGMIGQMLGVTTPELLQSLTLCDTTSRVPAEAKPLWDERITVAERQGMQPHVEPTVSRWFTPKFIESRPDVVNPVRDMIRRTSPRGYVGCCHAIRALDLTDRLAAVRLPTLVIVGAQDVGTPLAASQVIHGQIKGSELVILDPASHLSNLEQPEAFTQALEGFLRRVA
jgi:3-oxoadipate enol-lactonase